MVLSKPCFVQLVFLDARRRGEPLLPLPWQTKHNSASLSHFPSFHPSDRRLSCLCAVSEEGREEGRPQVSRHALTHSPCMSSSLRPNLEERSGLDRSLLGRQLICLCGYGGLFLRSRCSIYINKDHATKDVCIERGSPASRLGEVAYFAILTQGYLGPEG